MIKVEEITPQNFIVFLCCGDIDHTKKRSKVEPLDGALIYSELSASWLLNYFFLKVGFYYILAFYSRNHIVLIDAKMRISNQDISI